MKRLQCKFFRCFISLVLLFELSDGLALGAEYDATVQREFHGFLIVMASDCHSHQLTTENTTAFRAWGAKQFDVRVESHFENGLEVADSIYPRAGQSTLARCASDVHSFDASVDGVVNTFGGGQAIQTLEITTMSGARRTFTFLAGRQEPRIDGHIDAGKHVTVHYKIVDSPDGPSTQVTSINVH